MRYSNKLGLIVVGSLSLAFAGLGSAKASPFTISSTQGGSANAGATYANFDTGSDGLGISFTGNAGYRIGSTGAYAAPYLSGGNSTYFGNAMTAGADQTQYLSSGTGAVTINFGKSETYLGLLWGSIDFYNSLSFYDNGTLVGSVTSPQIIATPNGDTGINGTRYVNIASSQAFTSVVATSQYNSFEFDNLAYYSTPVLPPSAPSIPATSVPEPSSMLLLGTALLGIGMLTSRRNTRI